MRLTFSAVLILSLPMFAQETSRGVNFYSLEKEVALGRGIAADIRMRSKMIDDESLRTYVSAIVERLNQSARSPFLISVEVTADAVKAEPQALPGGFILVPVGAFLAARDEAALTRQLAHGLAHITARHGTRQATRAEIVNQAGVPLVFMGSWAYDHQTSLLPVGFRKFQEQFEADADRMADEWTRQNPAETGEFAAMQERARSFASAEMKPPTLRKPPTSRQP